MSGVAVMQQLQHLNRVKQSNDVQTIEKLMMDHIMQQLHMLKKLEFDGNPSDSLRSLRYTKQSTWKWWHQKVITHASCESVLTLAVGWSF